MPISPPQPAGPPRPSSLAAAQFASAQPPPPPMPGPAVTATKPDTRPAPQYDAFSDVAGMLQETGAETALTARTAPVYGALHTDADAPSPRAAPVYDSLLTASAAADAETPGARDTVPYDALLSLSAAEGANVDVAGGAGAGPRGNAEYGSLHTAAAEFDPFGMAAGPRAAPVYGALQTADTDMSRSAPVYGALATATEDAFGDAGAVASGRAQPVYGALQTAASEALDGLQAARAAPVYGALETASMSADGEPTDARKPAAYDTLLTADSEHHSAPPTADAAPRSAAPYDSLLTTDPSSGTASGPAGGAGALPTSTAAGAVADDSVAAAAASSSVAHITPPKDRVTTYIAPQLGKEDNAKVSVYAPLRVAPRNTFRVSVYMYLREDEKEVRAVASSGGATDRGTAVKPFSVRRGAQVTVLLYLPPVLTPAADTWLATPAARTAAAPSASTSKLAYLQAATAHRQRFGRAAPSCMTVPLPSADSTTRSGDAVPTDVDKANPRGPPSARADFLWSGRPEQADFWLSAKSEEELPRLGTYVCYASAISGTNKLTFRFNITIASQREVAASVFNAAALGGRVQRRLESATAHSWTTAVHGRADGVSDDAEAGDSVLGVGTGRVAARSVLMDEEGREVGDADDVLAGSEQAEAEVYVETTSDRLLFKPADLAQDKFLVQLAEGGHGRVLLSAFKDSSRVCVVKTPLHDPHQTPTKIIREFRHEARVQADLGHHPNLVSFMGVCDDPASLMLALEYLPLGSLRDALDIARGRTGSTATLWNLAKSAVADSLRRNEWAADNLKTSCGTAGVWPYLQRTGDLVRRLNLTDLQVGTQLARDASAGLSALHAAGYIHRDIAARNVLLSLNASPGDIVSGRVQNVAVTAKIGDVGLAMRLVPSADDDGSEEEAADTFSEKPVAGAGGAGSPSAKAMRLVRQGSATNTPSSSTIAEGDGYGTLQWLAPETIWYKVLSQPADVYMFGAFMYELFEPRGLEPWERKSQEYIFDHTFSPLKKGVAHGAAGSNHARPMHGLLGQLDKAAFARLPSGVQDVLADCLSYLHEFDAADLDADSTYRNSGGAIGRPTMAEVAQRLDAALAAM